VLDEMLGLAVAPDDVQQYQQGEMCEAIQVYHQCFVGAFQFHFKDFVEEFFGGDVVPLFE